MLNSQSPLFALLNAKMQPGRVVWIGIRPSRRAPVSIVSNVLAQAGKGLEGDHYRTSHDGLRQVTLLQAEHLVAIASYLGRDTVEPAALRRNIVVSGINLLALKGKRFTVGTALMEYTGECHPCSLMEETLGTGGYNAIRGHGGITARILNSGTISVGDNVAAIDQDQ